MEQEKKECRRHQQRWLSSAAWVSSQLHSPQWTISGNQRCLKSCCSCTKLGVLHTTDELPWDGTLLKTNITLKKKGSVFALCRAYQMILRGLCYRFDLLTPKMTVQSSRLYMLIPPSIFLPFMNYFVIIRL